MIRTRIDLNDGIQNYNGKLKKGGHYAYSCRKCTLYGKQTLDCQCKKNGHYSSRTSINLGEIIKNNNGHFSLV
jgi:hypothetical protein